jgi:hypothetical protein
MGLSRRSKFEKSTTIKKMKAFLKKNGTQQAAWQYGGATNIFSAFCSLFGFSSSRRNTDEQQN